MIGIHNNFHRMIREFFVVFIVIIINSLQNIFTGLNNFFQGSIDNNDRISFFSTLKIVIGNNFTLNMVIMVNFFYVKPKKSKK
jgi:hypothetical protein